MLDLNFCETLEFKLCEVLANAEAENLKGFWCDGVLLSEPENYYSKKFVSDNKQVKMKAFVGKTGQAGYTLTLKFGNKSLSRYERNLDIVECIPQIDLESCIIIDTLKQEITIQLH